MRTTFLDSKPHYPVLDGLRGVAALVVVAFHLFEAYSGGALTQIINHGYLAVDFFFLLSGYVIGYAYDDRWGKMSLKDFFKRRIIRLHPMVVMGSLIGMLLFYLGATDLFPLIEQTPWWKLLLHFLLGCLMLPALLSWDIRGWQELNSLNGPTWSLMFEYIANILYAVFIRHFSKLALAIFVAASAFLTLDLTLNWDLFGLLAERSERAYTVIGGWSITPTQLYIGFTRLLYPFFVGLLLSRMNALIRTKGGFWWCSLLLVGAMAMPRLGGETAMWMNGTYEAFCILLLFPLIVAMGAGTSLKGARSTALCRLLGDISYPLYITHYPLVYIQTTFALTHADAPLSTHILLGISLYIVALSVAYASLRLYDEPVRKWLTSRFAVRKKN